MTTLNDFKALRASVPPEVQTELYGLMISDPEAGKQRMVELAAEQGVTLTTEEVRGFLLQMNEEEEFDDIELKMSEILSDLERKVLMLYLDGRSYQEISVDLNRHVKSIDNALQRVKRKLERYLELREVSL